MIGRVLSSKDVGTGHLLTLLQNLFHILYTSSEICDEGKCLGEISSMSTVAVTVIMSCIVRGSEAIQHTCVHEKTGVVEGVQ